MAVNYKDILLVICTLSMMREEVKCQADTGPCRTIYLHGEDMSFPGDAGFYSLLNTQMNGRPTYIDDAGQEPLYLFYGIYDTVVGGYWVISANMNNILTGTRVRDNATSPEKLKVDWEELYRNELGDVAWKDNPTIIAECIDKGCETGRLLVGNFDEISHPLQVNLQGIYSIEAEIHNLRPVYKHVYSNWFIYYNTARNTDNNNTTFSYWAIGRNIGSDVISAIAEVNTPDPSFIPGSWGIYSNTVDSFVATESFKTKCVVSHTDYCRTSELLLSIDSDLPLLDGTLPLHDDLLIYIQNTIGAYQLLLNTTHNSRPVYKHVKKELYLYFVNNRANGYVGWGIGKVFASELGLVLFVNDYALRPELIAAEEWGHIDILSASVLPTLVHSDKIKLSCKDPTVEAGDDNCTNICHNGATCQLVRQFEQENFVQNVTQCLCQDGYYGIHCEKKLVCPAPPVEINNGSLIEHIHEGNSYLSLALYLCDDDFTMAMDQYFAVCGRNGTWENIPKCVEEPSVSLSETVHLAMNGEDFALCGNRSQPCKSLKYAILRVADGGTIYIHDTINQCGTQSLTGKTLTIEAWYTSTRGDSPRVTFNCGMGHNFLTLEDSKTTLKNLAIVGGVIFLSGTNLLNITNSTLTNSVIANGGILSEEIQLFVQNSVWANTLLCNSRSAAILYLSVLKNTPICDTFSRIDITPAGVHHLFVQFSDTSFYGTTLNIGGQLSTNINVENTLFTNIKSGGKQTRKFMNILIAKGSSSVNFTRSVFRDVVFEDTRGQDLFQQSALVLQEYVLTDRSEDSFVAINLLNCTFLSNTRAVTIQLSDHAHVNIIDSSFINNMAQGGGGAMWITLGRLTRALNILSIDLFQILGLDNRVVVTVSHSTFANNTAVTDAVLQNPGRGGAIFADATVELTIFGCTFVNNSARLLGGSIYTGPQGSVILAESMFTSAGNEHVLLGHILYIQGYMFVSNISLIGTVSNNDVTLLSYLGNPKLGNSFALIQSMNLTCPLSHSVKLENATHSYVNEGYEHLHYSCVSCPDGTYSTRGGDYWTKALVNNDTAEFSHRRLINITTVTNRKTSLTHIDCKPCPYGGFCQHGLKSRRNFWGHKLADEVQFRECLPGHGCNKEYCDNYNDCHPHRKGLLCSECEAGHSETFWGTACVSDKHCNNGWIWALVAFYGLLYVLFLLFEHEWKSFWHSQTSWFFRHTVGRCLKKENTTSGATQEHKERGLLRIFMYYVQVGVLLQLEILYQNNSSIVHRTKSFQDSVSEVVSFNVAPLHRNLCVMQGWDKVARLTYRGLFVLYLYAALLLIYPMWILLSRIPTCIIRSASIKQVSKQRRRINVRFLVVFLELLLFTYQAVTDISLLSIDCVQVGTEEVLSIKGSIECFQPWQYGMITVMILYVAPLFLVLLLGPPALLSGILPWPLFMISCIFPLVFPILYPVLVIKNNSTSKKANAPDPQSTAVVVADKINGPYRNVLRLCCWEGVVILQRFILGVIAAATGDMLVKHFLLALANLMILLLHVIVRPFKERSSNIVDITTLLFLSILSLIGLVKSVLYKVGVIPVGQLESIYYALEYINFILLVVLPFVLILLVIAFCLIHALLRVVVCLRSKGKETADNTVNGSSGSLNSSIKSNTSEKAGNTEDTTTDKNGYTAVSTKDEGDQESTSI